MTAVATIAIVGQPNVGKSTLFNALTKTRDALVLNKPGVTRDRIYGTAKINDTPAIIIDTGGLAEDTQFAAKISEQVFMAIEEADIVLFMIDAKAGLTSYDYELAKRLRRAKKNIYLVANKIDGIDLNTIMPDLYALGFPIYAISAVHNKGIMAMLTELLSPATSPPVIARSQATPGDEATQPQSIKVAIIGKPNAGKSTLINTILGQERVVAFDAPGTTQDSIYINFSRKNQDYTLIDTAGIRRKNRVQKTLEKFSVVKALEAIRESNVVVFMLDSTTGVCEQDLHLLGFVIEAGKSLIIACNKWDSIDNQQKQEVKSELDRRLGFLDYAEIFYISALHGTAVNKLFAAINRCYRSSMRELSTPQVTKILEQAVAAHQPPIVRKSRIKLRYAHAGGKNPPIIVVHGNQINLLPNSYKKYLENYFRKSLKIIGTPIKFVFKSSENPFAGK
jgi:GTP-binding protein